MIVRNGQKLGSVYLGSDPRYTGRGPAKKETVKSGATEPARNDAPAETAKPAPAKKAAAAPKAEKAPEKEA